MLASEAKKAAKVPHLSAPPVTPQTIARRAAGTLLFYRLGDSESYLWAITSNKTQLFKLPAKTGPSEWKLDLHKEGFEVRTDVLPPYQQVGYLRFKVRAGKRDRSPEEKVEHAAAERARFEELSAEMEALYEGESAPREAS